MRPKGWGTSLRSDLNMMSANSDDGWSRSDRMNIARRFNAGFHRQIGSSPAGTAEGSMKSWPLRKRCAVPSAAPVGRNADGLSLPTSIGESN